MSPIFSGCHYPTGGRVRSQGSYVLRSFNGPEPKKVKERRKQIFPGLHREPIKPLNRACTAHKGTVRHLEGVLKAWAGE